MVGPTMPPTTAANPDHTPDHGRMDGPAPPSTPGQRTADPRAGHRSGVGGGCRGEVVGVRPTPWPHPL